MVSILGNNVVFSDPLMFRDKAQCATNGCSIGKCCNAVAGHQGSALRVSLFAPMHCVVPFGKGAAKADPMSVANALAAANAVGLPCKARLAMNVDKLTEYDNITLKGH
jgi:hypothetical protein